MIENSNDAFVSKKISWPTCFRPSFVSKALNFGCFNALRLGFMVHDTQSTRMKRGKSINAKFFRRKKKFATFFAIAQVRCCIASLARKFLQPSTSTTYVLMVGFTYKVMMKTFVNDIASRGSLNELLSPSCLAGISQLMIGNMDRLYKSSSQGQRSEGISVTIWRRFKGPP